MNIRKAKISDIDTIKEIFDNARAYMRKNGNTKQWADGYPFESTIINDINAGVCMLCEEEGEIVGAFSLLDGPDKTYSYIKGNGWLNDEDYGVIHRIAVKSNRRGVASQCIKYGENLYKNLRIDTHEDNIPMRSFLHKHGFCECGIIYLENGEERIAYHKVISGETENIE
ncbi:MAG: GNAT family N-acetyltransferase [Clostridia bacterium]|nr:GNAT family N-acetyltransferase [Clostridia bacterium]